MSELINLRRIKKRAERDKAAEINRANFGRNKTEKAREEQAKQKASDRLDAHYIDEKDCLGDESSS